MHQTTRFDVGSIASSYKTNEGFERVYLRLAKVGHPYKYFNKDGTERIEVITGHDLFAPKSLVTAKGKPLSIGHPAFKFDSFNVQGEAHGALGESFIRETTNDGEFLGATATIYTNKAQEESKARPGVSPGYGVRIDRQDGVNFQRDRIYNHVALRVSPRGGQEVRKMFEGIRTDGLSEDIWIASHDDCYECRLGDEAWIQNVLRFDNAEGGLIQKTPVDLSAIVTGKPEEKRSQSDGAGQKENPEASDEGEKDSLQSHEDGENCGCEECKAKPARKRRNSTKGQGFSPDPNNTKKRKGKRMSTTTVRIDGVDYQEVPQRVAEIISDKVARLDSLQSELDQARNDSAEYDETMGDASETMEGLIALNSQLEERIDELEELASSREDEEDEDGRYYRDDELNELLVEGAEILAESYETIRNDAQALVNAGILEGFQDDFSYITNNMDEVREELILAVSPDAKERLDSYDGDPEKIETHYAIAMGAARQRMDSQSREDGYGNQQARGLTPLQRVGAQMPASRNDGGMMRPGQRPNVSKHAMKEQRKADMVFDAHSKASRSDMSNKY